MALKILLNGAKGRMGKAIQDVAATHEVEILAAVDVEDDPSDKIAACDVVVDFSFHYVTAALAKLAAAEGKPMVIGTTGHSQEDREVITQCAEKIPIVWAGNFSIGVNLLNYLTRKAASILGDDFNPEVIEMHHRFKKDAPSGTAERLVQIVSEARGLAPEQEQHGRKGIVGERPKNEIGVHALRGGDVVGEHTVMFAGIGERLELVHRASDRKIFAQGAIRAAAWVVGQEPGIYGMEEVLGLQD